MIGTMDLQADIKWIVSEVTKVQDPELISAFKSLLKYRAKQVASDWADDMSNAERESLEQAIAEADRGEFISHDDVMKETRERFNLK